MISIPHHSFAREFAISRSARVPWIKDGYEWFRQEKARMIQAAFWNVRMNKIDGDFLEFGVFEGLTFIEAWYAARSLELGQVRLHAFDSFAGLPIPVGPDADGPHVAKGCWAPRETFDRNVALHGVDPARITVTQGPFEETLHFKGRNQIGLTKAAIVWVDCDLFASTVPVLQYITDILVDGTVLVFDDWFSYKGRPDRGEQLACRHWLRENPHVSLIDFQTFNAIGKSFIVHLGQ